MRKLILALASATILAGAANAATVYPIDRATILVGSPFDFKVEFDAVVKPEDVKITVNGKDYAEVFGKPAEFVAEEKGAEDEVLGSALIIFNTYFSVQVSVAINAWYGPFYDMIQRGLARTDPIPTETDLFVGMIGFAGIAFVAITIGTLNLFFVSHYVFRWRTAMNDFYMSHWDKLRHIEGASQRVQDDTMRFSRTVEGLGVSLVSSIMTLVAFLPVLFKFSNTVTVLPFVGEVPHALVWAAVCWSLFGTVFLAVVGIKLPGLEFRNQRVEAAYRKELVYGEDHADRAQPPTVAELFANVRKNYFTLYFHYIYFNVVRYTYLQADNIFSFLILGPSIVAHQITLGLLNQVSNAFGRVTGSLQFLLNSWSTIVELQSVHKRLRAFEATIVGEPLPEIDQRYLLREEAGLPPEEQPAT